MNQRVVSSWTSIIDFEIPQSHKMTVPIFIWIALTNDSLYLSSFRLNVWFKWYGMWLSRYYKCKNTFLSAAIHLLYLILKLLGRAILNCQCAFCLAECALFTIYLLLYTHDYLLAGYPLYELIDWFLTIYSVRFFDKFSDLPQNPAVVYSNVVHHTLYSWSVVISVRVLSAATTQL